MKFAGELPTLVPQHLYHRSLRLSQNLNPTEGTICPMVTGCSVAGGKAISSGRTSSPQPLPRLSPTLYTNDPPHSFIAIYTREQAQWRRSTSLISHTSPQDELPSFETIFSYRKASNMIYRLGGNDVRACVDVVDEVRHRTLYSRGIGWFTSLNLLPSVGRHLIASVSHRILGWYV